MNTKIGTTKPIPLNKFNIFLKPVEASNGTNSVKITTTAGGVVGLNQIDTSKMKPDKTSASQYLPKKDDTQQVRRQSLQSIHVPRPDKDLMRY